MALGIRTTAILAAIAVLVISAIFSMKGPLQDVHWDAPIYVARGKQFAETPYLQDYMKGAPAIAEGLARWKIGEDTAYWGFIRLGNTILLGLVTVMMGANLASIYAGFLLYTLLLAAAVVTCMFLVLRLGDTSVPQDSLRRTIRAGALVSVALYLASDVYRYLSGNTVSEVPALLLIGGASLALVEGTRSRSAALGVVSGTLGFALYVVRAEAVWSYISFLLVLAADSIFQRTVRARAPTILTAGGTALLLYLCFAWLFWPLADPRLMVTFAAGVQEATYTGPSAIKLLFAAGGPLWIGWLLAVCLAPSNRLTLLSAFWLALTLLPNLDALLGHRGTETRMYALAVVPLLVGSSSGWASLAERAARGKVGLPAIGAIAALVITMIAISHVETYRLLRQLPGGWRFQYLREWLSPPNYERISYPVHELQSISTFVYGRHRPTVLIPDDPKFEENLRIIWYLAPSPNAERLDAKPEVETLRCGNQVLRPQRDHVVYCTKVPESLAANGDMLGVDVLYLRPRSASTHVAESSKEIIEFRTASFELVRKRSR